MRQLCQVKLSQSETTVPGQTVSEAIVCCMQERPVCQLVPRAVAQHTLLRALERLDHIDAGEHAVGDEAYGEREHDVNAAASA